MSDCLSNAADVTKKAGKVAVLKGEKEALVRKVKKLKKEFGLELYPLMENQDESTSKSIFEKYKASIDTLLYKITLKDKEISEVNNKGKPAPTDGLSC